MKLTNNDFLHAGLGLPIGKNMTALEFKNIRKSLGVTRKGMSELLGCDLNQVKMYDNETRDDGLKISQEHATQLRKIACMSTDKRNNYIKQSGCELITDSRFK